MKEAYRLNKNGLYDFLKERDLSLDLLIQYTQKEIKDFQQIESGMLTGFEKLRQELLK